MDKLARLWFAVDHRLRRHRRLIAAGLTAAAVLAVLHTLAPPAPATVRIVTAARDLATGTRLTPGDLRRSAVAPAMAPRGALLTVGGLVGRTVAAPQNAGSPLTSTSVVQPSLVARYGPGLVATPVRIADAGSVALVRVGDRVTVFAANGHGLDATIVVDRANVVAVPAPSTTGANNGALIVLATTVEQAANLTGAAARSPLTISLDGLTGPAAPHQGRDGCGLLDTRPAR